jgi:hypothetical protein
MKAHEHVSRIFVVVAIAALVLILGVNTGRASTITLSTQISGTINGEPIAAKGGGAIDPLTGFFIDGAVDDTTGRLDSNLLFTSIPSTFPVIAYDKSWKSKNHAQVAIAMFGGYNFIDIGATDFDFTSTTTYPNGDTITAIGSIRMPAIGHISQEMTMSGFYNGPLNIVTALGTTDLIKPDGAGHAVRTGQEVLILSDGSQLVAQETMSIDFMDPTLQLPFAEFLQIDLLTYKFDPGTSVLTISTQSTMKPVPAPATILLFGTGIAGLAGTRFRRRKH